MRRGLGIALIIATVAGLLAILSDSREPSEEDHLKAYYAAQRSYRALRASGSPTLGSTIMKYWHKLRGTEGVKYLNQMAEHHSALEDLGYFEKRTFVLSNRSAMYVRSNVHIAFSRTIVDGLANVWTSSATNQVYVMAPKADMPKWEDAIRKADVPE